jgi:hypothetical protein
MSDSIIIHAVYIAIGPFFVADSGSGGDTKGKKDNTIFNTFGKSAMRGLRLDALSLIRCVGFILPRLCDPADVMARFLQTTRISDPGLSKRS